MWHQEFIITGIINFNLKGSLWAATNNPDNSPDPIAHY